MLKKTIMKKITMVILAIFFIASVILMQPYVHSDIPQNRSATLNKKSTTVGNTTRTDYVDNHGNITIAAELGYATVITTTTGDGKLEHFYDENGEPIRMYSGFYALLKEYNENGWNTRIVYLDTDDLPMMTTEGFSEKRLTYYSSGKIKTEKYYDPSGNPVCTATYGYGMLNEYDENGKLSRITYLNAEDEPMLVGLGYAIVCRNYYKAEGPNKGKVESEFYFAENGKPIAQALGQYGVHKEYNENGQATVLTYLDADGAPIATKKGYTTVVRELYANNKIKTEQYYDLAGNPYHLPEGQYGIKKDGQQIVYLDKNGEETFNIKRLLYNQPYIIIACVLMLIFISGAVNKKGNVVLLIVYIASILYLTLMFRENEGITPPEILWHYRKILTNSEARDDILKNIWLFIPLGAILYKVYPKCCILLVPVLLSISIEFIQYTLGIGYCELDDIISNSLGGCIGFYTGQLTEELTERINKRSRIHTA